MPGAIGTEYVIRLIPPVTAPLSPVRTTLKSWIQRHASRFAIGEHYGMDEEPRCVLARVQFDKAKVTTDTRQLVERTLMAAGHMDVQVMARVLKADTNSVDEMYQLCNNVEVQGWHVAGHKRRASDQSSSDSSSSGMEDEDDDIVMRVVTVRPRTCRGHHRVDCVDCSETAPRVAALTPPSFGTDTAATSALTPQRPPAAHLRDTARAAAQHALNRGARLTAVVAPKCSGKTTLLQEIGREWVRRHGQGRVFCVSPLMLSNPIEIEGALEFDGTQRAHVDTIRAACREGPTLLLWDDFQTSFARENSSALLDLVFHAPEHGNNNLTAYVAVQHAMDWPRGIAADAMVLRSGSQRWMNKNGVWALARVRGEDPSVAAAVLANTEPWAFLYVHRDQFVAITAPS